MAGILFIGVDIGGTKTSVSLGNEEGQIINKVQFITKKEPQEVLSECYVAIDQLLFTIDKQMVKALGISCGGPLDSKEGIIQSPPNLPLWDDIPVVRLFQQHTNIPSYLENDANACALAEWLWGSAKGCDSMIFLTFGTGLGAGLILDGRLYRGSCGLAGEIGHWRMKDTGPLCYGKRGSWEGFCSGSGIRELYRAKTNINLSAKDVCLLAEKGDEPALSVIETSARALGQGLALLIDLLNPQCIVIGSIFSRSEALFRGFMEEEIQKEALVQTANVCKVYPSALGENLGDMAALGIAMDRYKQRGKQV
ncbi:MAG: ROK family protein [Sphaerochaeta sp.]|nr:ROK family protein [Sphaerochaeta sp.]